MKKPFVSLEQLQEIVKDYPTPFHLYDEHGIRANARALYKAFSWNPGFKEYFAVKATPNPQILKLLHEEGCGVDCSSLTELMMSDRCGFKGGEIMFSSNDTPAEEFALAAQLGATINLDDITHIDFLQRTIGHIPKKISCRFNPGGTFTLGESKEGFQVMDNPGDAKYGLTRPQMTEAFRRLRELGAEEFGIHVPDRRGAEKRDRGAYHLHQPVRRRGGALPPRPARQRHCGYWRGRAPRLRGYPRPRRHGRRLPVHRAGPLHAGPLRPSGDNGAPPEAPTRSTSA